MKTICEICNKETSTKNLKRHQKACSQRKNNLNCCFCGDEKKNYNSLSNHERLCKLNPDRKTTPFHDINFQQSEIKSNQFIKAKKNNKIYEVSIETREKLSISAKNNNGYYSEESNLKRKDTITNKINNGEWHTQFSTVKKVEYNGIKLDSSWEYKYIIYLESLGISWKRNKRYFNYEFEGKIKRYFPDFYLPETNEYVEIKGRKTNKDEAKWNQFPNTETLIVLFGNDLKQLGIL